MKKSIFLYKFIKNRQLYDTLYKSIKVNGTTVYASPSAAEDISASQMNTNYKMYFSKYVLINLPAQNLNPGSNTKLSLFTLT
jgi:hypothetical protein